MKKRILSVVLTLLMLVSMISVFAVPASAAEISLTVNPVVLIMGEELYSVVWETNNVSIGYVTYTYNGKKYTVYDEENGVVRSDDKLHTVYVPMAHLDGAGSYTVNSETVVSRDGYDIKTSDKISVSRNFVGYSQKTDISVAVLSDSHNVSSKADGHKARLQAMKKVITDIMGNPELVVINGDITDTMRYDSEFYALFDVISTTGFDGTRAVLYVMGNHEHRGIARLKMERVFTYETGEFYTRIDYGPASILICDMGEDKPDENQAYGDLNDMEHYLDEQYKYWYNHEGFNKDKQYHFSIGHFPYMVKAYDSMRSTMTDIFANFGTELHVGGHTHALKSLKPNGNDIKFPVFEDGAVSEGSYSSVKIDLKDGKYKINMYDKAGDISQAQEITAKNKGSSKPQPIQTQAEIVSDETETVSEDITTSIPTKAGVSTSAVKRASDSTAIVTRPAVFDTGEYYCIVWQSTPGVKSGGYVELAGQKKMWMDNTGGKLRQESTHSVRIPKEILSGKTYTVKSRVCTNYNAYGYGDGGGPTTYGPWATGKTVKFTTVPNDKATKYTVLAVANKKGDKDAAKTLLSKNTETPNLLVMLGDMVENLNKEEDFANIIEYAGVVTEGKYPVMFLRGEGESSGGFAANLARHIRVLTTENVLNRLYTSFAIGKRFSIIGLDTAASKTDSDSSYNGYAFFDQYRKEQVKWLSKMPSSFAKDYNLVFSNSDNLSNHLGNDFTKNFNKLNTQLVVAAGSGSASFKEGDDAYSLATVGDSNGLFITCQNDSITVKSVDTQEEIGSINIKEVTYGGYEPTPDDSENTDDPSDTPGNSDDTDDTNDEPSDTPGKSDDSDDTNDEPSDTPGNSDDPDDDSDNYYDDDDSNDSVSGQYVPGNSSLDGSIYIKNVPDGWYEDYLDFDIDVYDDSVMIDSDVEEGTFIYIVSRFAGVNDTLFDDDTKEDKASSWAESVGIVSGYMGSDDIISESTASAIVNSLFEIL